MLEPLFIEMKYIVMYVKITKISRIENTIICKNRRENAHN